MSLDAPRTTTMRGRVKLYDLVRAYGIIIGADGQDYFVHRTGIIGPPIQAGDAVTFQPVQVPGQRGPRALAVRRV